MHIDIVFKHFLGIKRIVFLMKKKHRRKTCLYMIVYINICMQIYVYIYTIHIYNYLTTNIKQNISVPRSNKFYIRS